jgi:hypothetical protein
MKHRLRVGRMPSGRPPDMVDAAMGLTVALIISLAIKVFA